MKKFGQPLGSESRIRLTDAAGAAGLCMREAEGLVSRGKVKETLHLGRHEILVSIAELRAAAEREGIYQLRNRIVAARRAEGVRA